MATKLAAVGEYDVIMPFKAVGVEIYPVTSDKDFIQMVMKLIEEEVGVIFLSDKFLDGVESIFKKVSVRPLPCLIPIPGPLGATEFARKRMRNLVKKACGVDIMGKRKESL
ncbi:hypothetical protein CH333_06225 [candidate division WOR-3 bacterium JGI_Cruoil_03_44_89]|uniref:V-type ATP synthase subunit F n=1 Tax=candidate division WOR-3 bacterium JGI_Cruoil_03_44_89 TaxID=1973748 RepID=A0A235BSQ2_UNCW3|nr:MAG: hypothetical protein CH333_06225 [candidate division WOR-3 bacterium JGI_Cruoil_03_44_89]